MPEKLLAGVYVKAALEPSWVRVPFDGFVITTNVKSSPSASVVHVVKVPETVVSSFVLNGPSMTAATRLIFKFGTSSEFISSISVAAMDV